MCKILSYLSIVLEKVAKFFRGWVGAPGIHLTPQLGDTKAVPKLNAPINCDWLIDWQRYEQRWLVDVFDVRKLLLTLQPVSYCCRDARAGHGRGPVDRCRSEKSIHTTHTQRRRLPHHRWKVNTTHVPTGYFITTVHFAADDGEINANPVATSVYS